MSDPRYRNGLFAGNAYQHRRRSPQFVPETPLLYGWQPIDRFPDGRRTWQLESNPRATMHRLSQAEQQYYGVTDEWVVYLDGKLYASYTNTLKAITDDVKAALAQQTAEVTA